FRQKRVIPSMFEVQDLAGPVPEKLKEAMERYMQVHPVDYIPQEENALSLHSEHSTPVRIDYKKIDLPEELKEVAFTQDYIQGEKYYWEQGLRENLYKQEKQGQIVGTDGKVVIICVHECIYTEPFL